MRSGSARGGLLALLSGAALAASPVRLHAAPAAPAPEGFRWEELKEIHAAILRPEKWFFRRIIPAHPFFDLSPQPFENAFGVTKGVAMHVMVKTDQPADEVAAGWVAHCAERNEVLRGWTRKGVPSAPFTTYGLVCVIQSEESNGVKCILEIVVVVNRVTNTTYQCWVVAPYAEWNDVAQVGETMLANLQLDPEF